MKRISIFLIAALCSLLPLAVSANVEGVSQEDSIARAPIQGESVEQNVDQMWDVANTAYINAAYSDAIHVYHKILNRGVASSKLYYNLGNSYFKLGKLGCAILYYNRALKLDHSDEDARFNLEVAKAMTKDNIEVMPRFFVVEWFISPVEV